jgi:phosphohistidine phosphatase
VIYLLRHGDAEDGAGDDAARRLTPKGERQASAAGRALAVLGAEVDVCLTSPKLRAADTARIACDPLSVTPEVATDLRGGGFDAPALAAGHGDVLMVGHEPDLSAEVARLTGARVKMKKGGLVILDGSMLVALLRPAELARISGVAAAA